MMVCPENTSVHQLPFFFHNNDKIIYSLLSSYVSKIIENTVYRNLDLYAAIRATFSNRLDVVFDSDLDIVQPQINHNWVRGWWLIRE